MQIKETFLNWIIVRLTVSLQTSEPFKKVNVDLSFMTLSFFVFTFLYVFFVSYFCILCAILVTD